jgi:hypothetical protein
MCGKAVPFKTDEHGSEITDTQTQKNSILVQHIDINYDRPIFIGSKINVPYLWNLDRINDNGYPVIAIVRDPVYTIGSWNRYAHNIGESHVMPNEFEQWPRYKNIQFKTNSLLTRQAELWNHFAEIILSGNHLVGRIVRYEDLVVATNPIISKISQYLACDFILERPILSLTNMNYDDKVDKIDEVREAVKRHAPMAASLGYAQP